jgi:ribose 5-phosphate isomerase B
MRKIAIGSDHAGFERKQHIINYLRSLGWEVEDFGTNSMDSTDYPEYAHKVALAVENKYVDFGVLFCGSANGVSMTANKHQGVRAALSWNPEIARLGKEHNNANVVAIPARYVSNAEAEKIVKAFLDAEFEGGRHLRRVNKIPADSH